MTIEQMAEIIINVFVEYFGIPFNDICAPTRRREIADIRQALHYAFREFIPAMSYQEIGTAVGNKNHATVINSCRVVRNRIQTEPKFARVVELLFDEIKASLKEAGMKKPNIGMGFYELIKYLDRIGHNMAISAHGNGYAISFDSHYIYGNKGQRYRFPIKRRMLDEMLDSIKFDND